jgi:bifunctional UDP-N-acetylglucosamine pyrophosphorylase / glucosamine-1-phosphate N-acetyltransferase
MKTQIIILAAGHGKRMQSELPKALISFCGKPFISHILGTVAESGVCSDPIIVVGQKKEQIIEKLGPSYTYVFQEEQLGTGHAVMMAEAQSQGSDAVLVLYADHPLVSSKTITQLVSTHESSGATITMATSVVPDFNDWRSTFVSFGRLMRDAAGSLVRIIEAKDATEEEKTITEINPGYMCFSSAWLWGHLHALKNENIQKEYYLTDLVSMAFSEGMKISTVAIEPKEALGVNTKEQLELIENLG